MKPRDVYNAPCLTIDHDLWSLEEFFDGIELWTLDRDKLDAQTRITVKTHFDPYIDGERGASLYSVYLDMHPVMICKNAGRPDREHSGRFITDKERFKELLQFLRSMGPPEDVEVFELDNDIPDLDVIYTFRLTPKSLGPIPDARHRFASWLKDWSCNWSWPYPASFPGWKGLNHPENPNPTLADKQVLRWTRIQEQAERLLAIDPSAVKIAALAKNTHGTDQIIAEMKNELSLLGDEQIYDISDEQVKALVARLKSIRDGTDVSS